MDIPGLWRGADACCPLKNYHFNIRSLFDFITRTFLCFLGISFFYFSGESVG